MVTWINQFLLANHDSKNRTSLPYLATYSLHRSVDPSPWQGGKTVKLTMFGEVMSTATCRLRVFKNNLTDKTDKTVIKHQLRSGLPRFDGKPGHSGLGQAFVSDVYRTKNWQFCGIPDPFRKMANHL